MPERRCRQIFAMLSDFLEGALAARNCRPLQSYLKGCPSLCENPGWHAVTALYERRSASFTDPAVIDRRCK
jgi:hypothetical protein